MELKEIKFFRGNYHQIRFKFKTYTGTPEKIYLTVRCEKGYKQLHKRLGNGIELVDDWYVITFLPEDTNDIDCSLDMTYDIEIVVDNKKPFTIKKDKFTLLEENTRPEDEV